MLPSVFSCTLLAARGGTAAPSPAPIFLVPLLRIQLFCPTDLKPQTVSELPWKGRWWCPSSSRSKVRRRHYSSGGKLSFKWEADSCSSASMVYSPLSFAWAQAGSMEQQTPSRGHRNYNYNYIKRHASRLLSVSQKSQALEACRMAQWIIVDSDLLPLVNENMKVVQLSILWPYTQIRWTSMYTSAGYCLTACVKRAGQGEATAAAGFKVNITSGERGDDRSRWKKPRKSQAETEGSWYTSYVPSFSSSPTHV